MANKSYFGPGLFAFLRDLAKNNNRDWFLANKERYESQARDPMLRFISDFAPVLAKISKQFVADPKPVGGSLFRIYRDTRFAKDKSPYKTMIAAHFRHKATRNDVHAPGFYLHLEVGTVFTGAGLWHPDAPALKRVRDTMVAKPAAWKKAIARIELGGDSLKRPPRGYDAEHPLVEDLKRQDFVTLVELPEKAATGSDFMEKYAATCRAAAPLCEFLTKTQRLPF